MMPLRYHLIIIVLGIAFLIGGALLGTWLEGILG